MKKKRYLINVWYSDWVEAESEEDAKNIMADRVISGEIKTHEWTYENNEEDDVVE